MICVSLANISYNNCIEILEKEELAEIRIDKLSFSIEEMKQIFSLPCKLVATCRPGKFDDTERKDFLKTAISAGASYVDIEVESPTDYTLELTEFAHKNNCKVIISYHNFLTTPDIIELEDIAHKCFGFGADLAKIVTTVNNNTDRARIFYLYSISKKIIAFGMGEKGKITRLLAPLMGAEFTYASLGKGKEVAPGQIDKETMEEIIQQLKEV